VVFGPFRKLIQNGKIRTDVKTTFKQGIYAYCS
jgi:hypothetical protein